MSRLIFPAALSAFLITGTLFSAESAFDQYRAWPEGNQTGPAYEQDFSTGNLKVFTSYAG